MHPLVRFIKKYNRRLLFLWVEEVLGWLLRSLPGFLPGLLRYGFYRLMFRQLKSFALIYPGVRFTHSYGIAVGHSFSINSGALIDGRGGVTIGDQVMIGPYVVIVSSDHDFRQTVKPMSACDHLLKPVTIGNDVWIGAQAVICAGVTIGSGVVVAAGAVVTADVNDFEIVGGVPARVFGTRDSATSPP
jgi:acetyltransferase-like isoleucine patch superfamily enzyme